MSMQPIYVHNTDDLNEKLDEYRTAHERYKGAVDALDGASDTLAKAQQAEKDFHSCAVSIATHIEVALRNLP